MHMKTSLGSNLNNNKRYYIKFILSFIFCFNYMHFCSSQKFSPKFELKLSVLYAKTNRNITYSHKLFNSYKGSFDGDYYQRDHPTLTDEFVKTRYYKGISKTNDYLTIPVDLYFRIPILYNKIDIAWKVGYFLKKREYQYLINNPFFLTFPSPLINLITTSEYLHYFSTGLQIGFRLPRYSSWFRLGLDFNFNFERNADFEYIQDIEGVYNLKVRHIRHNGWDRSWPVNIELSRNISDRWTAGIGIRYLYRSKPDQSVREEFELLNIRNGELTHKGIYTMKDYFFGAHVYYRFQFKD